MKASNKCTILMSTPICVNTTLALKEYIQTSGHDLANVIFASTSVTYHTNWSIGKQAQPTKVQPSPPFCCWRTHIEPLTPFMFFFK
jgi:hypothetical protein